MDFQIWLDRYADTVVQDDFATFASMTFLPLVMETASASWTISTRAELNAGFDQYRAMLATRGVNLCARTLKSVEELPTGEVNLTYDNHLLRDSLRVFAVTQNVARLRQDGGIWRAAHIFEMPTNDESKGPIIELADLHRKAVEHD